MGTSLFDSGEPSAIANMMGLLQQTPAAAQGSGPMEHITPQQMPQMPPPTFAQQPKRLVDRLHDRMQGLLDSMRPSAPQGYEGLLSADEIKQANPGILGRLASITPGDPTPSEKYRNNLDHLIGMHQIADKIGEQKQIAASRQKMIGMFQPPPNETDSERHQRMESMAAYAAQNGDFEAAKQIGGILKDLKDKRFQVAGADLFDLEGKNGPTLLNPHDRAPAFGTQEWFRDYEMRKKIDAENRVSGAGRSEPIVQIEGPDGQPTWVPRSQAIGQHAKTTTHEESAMGVAAKARLSAAISEMNNAHAGMAEYEKGLSDGSVKINAGAQVLQRLANSFTHDDPASMLLQSGALSALNRSDPALARYIRRGLSFAEGESMVSQRPSDFRTKMAAFLSTAASGASPDMVHDIQSRRTSILTPLNQVSAEHSTPKGTGRATGQAPSSVPSYEEWKKAHGH